MENINCNLCNSTDMAFFSSQTDILYKTTEEKFKVVKCNDCSLVFTSPRPSKDEIGKYYLNSYSFHRKASSFRLVVENILDSMANNLVASVLFNYVPKINKMLLSRQKPVIKDNCFDFLKSFSGTPNYLDIGCGSGVSAHYFGRKGSVEFAKKMANCYAVEVGDDARKVLEEKGIESYACLDSVKDNLKFDCIRMNWSLEHVHDPMKYFKFLESRLNKNGLIMIAVPNIDGIIPRLLPDCLELPIHLYHFSKKTLEDYASKVNLKVESVKTFSYPGMFSYTGEHHKGLSKFKNMSLIEGYYFNKSINRFNETHNGNDIIITLRKS